MKCHAGIEFKSGSPCPKCGAKLGEVCWPGINADLAELPKVRTALREMVDTFKPFTSRPIGAPNSSARLDQEHQITVHKRACELLAQSRS